MKNQTIEFTTLRELNESLGLILESFKIEETLKAAKPEKNKFYIGTNVYEWLSSFRVMTDNLLEERYSDSEGEAGEEDYLDHSFEILDHNNSYNWDGNSNTDIDFKILQDQFQNVYMYVRIHCGGDIRGNYTEGILLDLDTYSTDYLYTLIDRINEKGEGAYIEYQGDMWSIDSDIISQELILYNHTTDETYEVYNSVYCWNEQDFNNECIDIIKEALQK